MSIQKKSLISALKTTQKANVAAAPVAEAGKTNTSMRAGNNFSMKKNAISLKKKNGAQHSGMMLFDVSAQGLKGLLEWTLAHDHRQYPIIEQ